MALASIVQIDASVILLVAGIVLLAYGTGEFLRESYRIDR